MLNMDEKQTLDGVNPFHTTGLFLYPLKVLDNQRFSDVLGGYTKRSVI